MNLTGFITQLEQDANLFKHILGLTQDEFDELYTQFQKSSDRTRKLNEKEKLYALIIYKKWQLDPSKLGQLIFSSSNAKRDGKTFIDNAQPRLQLALNLISIALKEKINSLFSAATIPTIIFDLKDFLDTVKQEENKHPPIKYERLNTQHHSAKEPIINHDISPKMPDVKTEKQNYNEPAFVINTAAYVPSDTETSSSSDSDDAEDFEFSDSDFDSPPYYIESNKRGSLESEISITNEHSSSSTYVSKVVQPLLDKLEEEGFADSEDSGNDVARKRLSVSLGLNRPRSLSTGKNRVLTKELTAPVDSSIQYQRFGLFWNYDWAKNNNATAEKRRNNPVSYEEVRSFYKQLKARDPEAAQEFRRSQENQSRNGMVPYRELREITKNHNNTRMLVIDARKKNLDSDIYLSFIDSDTQSFCAEHTGIYQTYTQLYHKHQAPEVMSSGYEFFKESMPILTLACILDRRVRAATANFVPLGIYYPEPNFIIKIIEGIDTITESFFELTPTGKISKKNYESPQEAPLILEKIAKRPGANRPHFFSYVSQNPLVTNAPLRATQNKSKVTFQFDGKLDENQKYIEWSAGDITNITRNIAQSHVAPRDWAINLLHAFEFNTEIVIGNNIIKDGSVIRNIAISLLSRLYKAYDPITLCDETAYLPNEDYQQKLHRILTTYDNSTMDNHINTTARPKKSKPLPNEKRKKIHKKNTEKQIKEAWQYVDALTTIQDLSNTLKNLLKNADVMQIENAAKASGDAICQTLLEYLQFPLCEATHLQNFI